MNIMPSSYAQSSSGTGGTTSSNGALPTPQGLNNMFMQLLVAQLQNQSPLNPMDPTQFVGQLAQFSELSEVTSIDQQLQQILPAKAGSTTGSGATGKSQADVSPANSPIPAAMLSAATTAAQAAVPNFSQTESFLNHRIQGVF